MPSVEILTPMKRKGEVLSIKSLNAQINAMMQAICVIEDDDSRIQFIKRVEAVHRALHCLRSDLESHMPRKLKRPSTLDIDHSLRLIGSPEEGYMPLTKKIWQNVLDITQRIDRLSEGLAFVVQRQLRASRSDEDLHLHSDNGDFDQYVQDKTTCSGGADDLNGINYSFEYSQSNSDGQQVRISYSHAKRYYQSPNDSQGDRHNQFTRGPNDINSHYDRFTSSPSSQFEAARNHPHRYFTGYSGGSPSYVTQGRWHSQNGESLYQNPNAVRPGPSSWCIPTDISEFGEFNNHSSPRKYPRYSQRAGARHTDFVYYSQD